MANLSTSDVSVLEFWTEGDVHGKRLVVKRVQITVPSGGCGGGTNQMVAAAFGLSKLVTSSPFLNSTDNLIVPTAVLADGTAMRTCDVNNATAANQGAVADVAQAKVLVGIVKGYR